MIADSINAFATTIIAALVALITWKQWVTDRKRLLHEKFDRRIEIYEQVAGFLSDVLSTGRIAPQRDWDFLRHTKRAYFVFGGDAQIEALISDIYRNAVDLQALQEEQVDQGHHDRKKNIEKQREIKEYFLTILASLNSTFGKHLLLRD
ncbi:MAG: hypothetical protein MN733_26530 [Nitrososphaera sp.]|nr:hypothetical protein [Nitrososphaera sp.]